MIGRIWNWLRWKRASRKLVSSLIRAARRNLVSDEGSGVRIIRGHYEFYVSETSLSNDGIHWQGNQIYLGIRLGACGIFFVLGGLYLPERRLASCGEVLG